MSPWTIRIRVLDLSKPSSMRASVRHTCHMNCRPFCLRANRRDAWRQTSRMISTGCPFRAASSSSGKRCWASLAVKTVMIEPLLRPACSGSIGLRIALHANQVCFARPPFLVCGALDLGAWNTCGQLDLSSPNPSRLPRRRLL